MKHKKSSKLNSRFHADFPDLKINSINLIFYLKVFFLFKILAKLSIKKNIT